MRPRRAPPSPAGPAAAPSAGLGATRGGSSAEGEGTARAVLERVGAGPGPDAAPLHLQYFPSTAVGPPGTRPPSSGWPPPPSGASAARAGAAGGAGWGTRTSQSRPAAELASVSPLPATPCGPSGLGRPRRPRES